MHEDAREDAVQPALEYERPFAVSRRQWRVLMLMTLLNTLLLGWFVVGPQTTRMLQSQWTQWQARRAAAAAERQMLALQQQCLSYTASADQVIYEEEPKAAQGLVATQAGYQPLISDHTGDELARGPGEFWAPPAKLSIVPPCWGSFATLKNVPSGMLASPSLPVVYLGQRTTPRGVTQLVVVQLDARLEFMNGSFTSDAWTTEMITRRGLYAAAYDLASPGKPAMRKRELALYLVLPDVKMSKKNKPQSPWVLDSKQWLTLLAGQRDPSDVSHFTIPYRLNGSPDTIDGWLNDGGILLKPRTGRPTTKGGVRSWDLIAPPATGPSSKSSRP